MSSIIKNQNYFKVMANVILDSKINSCLRWRIRECGLNNYPFCSFFFFKQKTAYEISACLVGSGR